MSAHEVTMYQVKCDCCGRIENEYGDYYAMTDFGDARENAIGSGWEVVGDDDLCPICWCWPEDLPDYPGDDAWTGEGDPVRKPGEHPDHTNGGA